MAGTISGGKKAAQTNKQRYGMNFYVVIGAVGGRASTGGGFAMNHELAKLAGRKGGRASRRYSSVRAGDPVCHWGHTMSMENTRWTKSGRAYCRICMAELKARREHALAAK